MIVPLTMAMAGIAVLATMSAIAYRRIAPGRSRLAMRWNLRGEPTWSLPRPLTLGLTPVLASIALPLLALTRTVDAWVIASVAAALILGHSLHLFLLARLR